MLKILPGTRGAELKGSTCPGGLKRTQPSRQLAAPPLSSLGGEVRKHSPVVKFKWVFKHMLCKKPKGEGKIRNFKNSLTSKTQSFAQAMTSFRLIFSESFNLRTQGNFMEFSTDIIFNIFWSLQNTF